MISDHSTRRALEPQLRMIEPVVDVFLHRHDVSERMHVWTIQLVDIIAKHFDTAKTR